MSLKRFWTVNGTLRVTVSSFIVCFELVSSGAFSSWASPAVPDINDNLNAFYVDPNAQSWIGGLVSLGAILGGLVGGQSMDYLGRKLTLMISTIPVSIGWVIIISSTSVPMIYAGRFIGGASAGLASGAVHVYVAETAPANLRGSLCSLGGTFSSIGTLYAYSFGYFLHWQWLGVACFAIVLANIIFLTVIPESPRWLLIRSQNDKSKYEEARKSLQWVRGSTTDVEPELKEMEQSILDSKKVAPWKDLLHKKHLKSLGICLTVFTVSDLCGNSVIKTYTVSIFDAAGTTLDSYLQTIVVGIVALLGFVVSVFLPDILGRRILLIESTAFVSLSMTTLGAYFYIHDTNPDYAAAHLSWLPLFSLMLCSFAYGTGIGGIPYLLPSELFPTELRGKSHSVIVPWKDVCSFISSKFFVNLTGAIGTAGGFWVCAGIGAAGCVFCIVVVPETKKKSLEKLQVEIAGKN